MFSKSLVILLAALSVANVVVGSPHSFHRRHHHGLVARSQSEAKNVSGVSPRTLRRRGTGCRPRTPPSSSAAAPANTPVANVAPAPATSTSSTQEAAPTTHQQQQEQHTQQQEQHTQQQQEQHTQNSTPTTTEQPQQQPTQGSDNGSNNNNNGGDNSGINIPGIPSFASGSKSGEGTYYDTGLVACGQTYSNTDYIAAVSKQLFDAWPGAGVNPNLNPICGKKVRASLDGKSVEVTIVDRCEGCAMWDLDFTPSAFQQLADMARGRVGGVAWSFI